MELAERVHLGDAQALRPARVEQPAGKSLRARLQSARRRNGPVPILAFRHNTKLSLVFLAVNNWYWVACS